MAVIQSGASADLLTVDPVSKALRGTLYDAAGNLLVTIDAAGTHTGTVRLGIGMTQDVHGSILNSSTAAIAAGAFFTGIAEVSLGVAGLQVNIAIDQACTVFVDQGPDGINWPLVDSWSLPAGAAGGLGVSRTVQATDLYYRVRVQNNGIIPTVSTRITTALCPVVEAVPRVLSPGGNLKITPAADWQDSRMVQGLYAVSSFRTIGNAGVLQYIFSIENPVGNVNNIAIRSLSIMSDSTVLLATVAQQVQLARMSAVATGGTAWAAATIPKYRSLSPFDRTVSVPNATAIPRQNASSDGVLGAAIVPGALGSNIWQQYLDRSVTLVGANPHTNYSMIPDVGSDLRQIILEPNEGLCLTVTATVTIPATTHMIVNCAWTEYKAR